MLVSLAFQLIYIFFLFCFLNQLGRLKQFILGVCAVRYGWFFSKFIIEPREIGFFIIGTDAHRLGSVFRPIAVRFFAVQFSRFGRFEILKKNYFVNNKKIGLSSPISIYQPVQETCVK